MTVTSAYFMFDDTVMARIDGIDTFCNDATPEIVAWVAAGNIITPYVAPKSFSPAVSVRQFYQAAAEMGLITKAEAKEFFVAKAIPSSLATAVAAMPEADRFVIEMSILGATSYLRTDPFVIALGALMGLTSAQIDALFTLAATL